MTDEATLDVLFPQAEMVQCEAKWAAARGGTGSGKTVGWCLWLIGRLEDYPLAAHFIVGSDYEQLRRGAFQTFTGLLDRIGYVEEVDYHYRESPSPMVVFPKSGARLRSISAKLAERIRSVEFQTLLLEEPQTWTNGDKIFAILSGRLRHSQRSSALYGEAQVEADDIVPAMQTRGRMSFNPPARGSWLHKLIEKKWPTEAFPCWQMSVRENWLLRDREEYVRGLEMALDPSRWPSEIDGEWATLGGTVYRMYDENLNGQPAPGLDFKIDPKLPLKWSLDFNVSKMCSVIAQVHEQPIVASVTDKTLPIPGWQRNILRVLGELVVKDAGSPDVVERFVRDYGDAARGCTVELYGDASGGSRSQTASAQSAIRTNWDAIEAGLTAANIPFVSKVPKANPSVGDRINATNAQMRTGEGIGLMLDPEAVPDLVADFMQVERAANGVDIEKKKDPERTHSSDAAGYLCYAFREVQPAFAFYA